MRGACIVGSSGRIGRRPIRRDCPEANSRAVNALSCSASVGQMAMCRC